VQRPLIVLLVALGALASLVSGALGASAPSGDPAAIAFYRQVQSAYGTVQAISGSRRGFIAYQVSSKTAFRFSFGQQVSAGYHAASESLLYLMTKGRVSKFVDTLRAPGLPPLVLIEDASGFWGQEASRPGACYSNLGSPALGTMLASYGGPFVGVYGHFSPLEHAGSTVIVRSSYPWGSSGAQAMEVDRISSVTRLLLSLQVQVNGTAPFAFSELMREQPVPGFVPASSPHC
jgi:hypothetical protein